MSWRPVQDAPWISLTDSCKAEWILKIAGWIYPDSDLLNWLRAIPLWDTRWQHHPKVRLFFFKKPEENIHVKAIILGLIPTTPGLHQSRETLHPCGFPLCYYGNYICTTKGRNYITVRNNHMSTPFGGFKNTEGLWDHSDWLNSTKNKRCEDFLCSDVWLLLLFESEKPRD